MRKYQKGFTFAELLALIVIFVWLAVVLGIGYVAIHFITKFW